MVPLIPGMMSTHHWERARTNFRKQEILEQMSVGKALGREVDNGQQDTFSSKLNQLRPGSQLLDGRGISSKFAPEDFRIGGEGVKLYGRAFHSYPDDHSSHVDEIEAIKLRLRAKTASAAASRAEATRKFHENSQKVLRFYVSWHDPHPLYPETRKCVLHYYLSDETVEVIEPKEQVGQHQPQHIQHQQQLLRERMGVSGGHHHFAVLISRRRVARDDLHQVPRLFDERPSGKQLLTDRDLRCGEWVTILSRTFLLEDCDPFTRDYYLETHGVTQEPCELLLESAGAKASKWKLFQAKALPESRIALGLGHGPGGGSGHQLGFSPALMQRLEVHVQDNQELNKSNKIDKHSNAVALADNSLDKKQLRFRAKFHGVPKSGLNARREFTLTYFLEDDTLCVFEPRVKNSGVAGGRFLDRGRFRKCCVDSGGCSGTKSRESQKERSAYCAADFFVGAIVQFEFSPNQCLELVAADQQTLSYCESHSELFPFSNSKVVLELVAKALLASKSADLVRRECRNLDKSGRRVLTLDEFRKMLDKLRLAALLNKQQLLTLGRKFALSSSIEADNNSSSRNEPLSIAYDEFCDAIACRVMTLNPNAAAQQNEIWLRKLTKVPSLRSLLRNSDPSNAQVVAGDALLRILSFYHVGLSANDLEALMARFSHNGAVEYHKLCDAVFQLSPSQSAADYSLKQSKPQHRQQQDDEDDDEFDFSEDDLAQHCEPPGATTDFSPRRTTAQPPPPTVPKLHLQASKLQLKPQQQHHQSSSALATAPRKSADPSDARVVAILRRVFGSRKYQLRKALRERDTNKSGQLGGEEFMDAVLSIEPKLSDDDTYAIADAYFPTNNCRVDYAQLLESAFRT